MKFGAGRLPNLARGLFAHKADKPAKKAEEGALLVVFGASWNPLPTVPRDEEEQAAKDTAREAGGTAFAVVYGGGEASVGSAKGSFARNVRLAGQLLASVVDAERISTLGATDVVQSNDVRSTVLMFLGAHSPGQYVVVAVLNGVPVLDLLGPLEQVKERAREFLGRLSRGGVLLVERGECQTVFADVMRGAPAGARAVDGLPFDAAWRTRTGPLMRVGVSRAAVLVAGTAVFALGLPAVWYGYRELGRRREMERVAQAAAAIKANASADFERLQLAALAQASLAQAAPAGAMVWTWVRTLLDARAGFRLDKLVINPTMTQGLFNRAARSSTFREFVSVSDEGTPSFDVTKLDAGAVAYPVLAWGQVPQLDVKNTPPGAGVLLELGSLAQRVELVGVKVAITPPAAVLNTEQLGRIDELARISLGRKAGAWAATGPLDLFADFTASLPPTASTLSEVIVTLSRDGKGVPADTFAATGRFIVGWT